MIEVLYSCAGCGLRDAKVLVKPREQGQDVVKWVNSVGVQISGHHSIASPRCKATTMEYVKIPISKDAEGIGFEVAP